MDKFASRLMLANVANCPFVLSGNTGARICGSSFSVTVANGSSSVHAVNVEPTASRANSAIYIFFIMDDCLIVSFQYPTTEGCANYLFLPCARWLRCSSFYYRKIPIQDSRDVPEFPFHRWGIVRTHILPVISTSDNRNDARLPNIRQDWWSEESRPVYW